VGPETKNALPSAQKFKDKLLRQVRLGSRVRLWRPVAALAVAVSAAVVYVEDQPSINPDHPKATQPLASGFIEHHVYDSLDPPDKLIYGSFSIAGLQDKQADEAKITSLSEISQPSPVDLSSPSENEADLSRITGYYCEQVPGYPIGDGGGYCGNTASGEPVRSGIAACGDQWSLRTKLFIEDWGEVECLDRGYLGYNQIDIFFPTNKDWVESGKPDWAKVTIIEE